MRAKGVLLIKFKLFLRICEIGQMAIIICAELSGCNRLLWHLSYNLHRL